MPSPEGLEQGDRLQGWAKAWKFILPSYLPVSFIYFSLFCYTNVFSNTQHKQQAL